MIIDDKGKVLAVDRLEQNSEQQGQIRYVAVCEIVKGQGLGQKIIAELELELELELQASKLGMTAVVLNARENTIVLN